MVLSKCIIHFIAENNLSIPAPRSECVQFGAVVLALDLKRVHITLKIKFLIRNCSIIFISVRVRVRVLNFFIFIFFYIKPCFIPGAKLHVTQKINLKFFLLSYLSMKAYLLNQFSMLVFLDINKKFAIRNAFFIFKPVASIL